MGQNLKLVVYDMDKSEWGGAYTLAWHFIKEFPDRVGMRNGCSYSSPQGRASFYVYRTKTSVVVRGLKEK